MRRLFSGEVEIDYRQVYLQGRGGEDPYLEASFAGQSNGLCGAAWPGVLFLITGSHHGAVEFTVELHDAQPPVDEAWEDIVEASFASPSLPVALVQTTADRVWPLELDQADYRVRYCCSGTDETPAIDSGCSAYPLPDRYLLQLWRSPARPDQIIKQTTRHAAYWHRFVAELPVPSKRATTARQRFWDIRELQ